jgi:hypothetical protein
VSLRQDIVSFAARPLPAGRRRGVGLVEGGDPAPQVAVVQAGTETLAEDLGRQLQIGRRRGTALLQAGALQGEVGLGLDARQRIASSCCGRARR